MQRFFQVMGVLGILALSMGIAFSHVSTKPFVRNGQEDQAAAIVQQVKLANAARSSAIASIPMPRASCEFAQYDFGLMDPLTVGSHVFQIANNGTAALTIRGGQSSCKCTLSDLTEATIAPGETFSVTLTWNSGHASRQFQQSATILTNDPTLQ